MPLKPFEAKNAFSVAIAKLEYLGEVPIILSAKSCTSFSARSLRNLTNSFGFLPVYSQNLNKFLRYSLLLASLLLFRIK